MFFDWLTAHQDFDYQLPLIGDRAFIVIDTETSEQLQVKTPAINHEGSFSTQLQIRISGNRLTVSGNPSRIDRLDNLFGFSSLDQCFAVYNRILRSYGLPEFTKCTRILLGQQSSDKVARYSDGAVITEVHITSNKAVGQGMESA